LFNQPLTKNKTPLYVPDNGEVVVTMYRKTDNRKVWYEWMVEVFRLEPRASADNSSPQRAGTPPVVMSGANNSYKTVVAGTTNNTKLNSSGGGNGYRRIRVGMSEMHSSIKDGCLM
jgi:type II protein arginine methyltransferase